MGRIKKASGQKLAGWTFDVCPGDPVSTSWALRIVFSVRLPSSKADTRDVAIAYAPQDSEAAPGVQASAKTMRKRRIVASALPFIVFFWKAETATADM